MVLVSGPGYTSAPRYPFAEIPQLRGLLKYPQMMIILLDVCVSAGEHSKLQRIQAMFAVLCSWLMSVYQLPGTDLFAQISQLWS
jgi:hypothetical protein